MEDLGRRLKEVRVRAGLTLRELARMAEVSPSLITQIENGKSQPSVATLYPLSRLLKVSVDDLFEDGTDGVDAGDRPHHPTDPITPGSPRSTPTAPPSRTRATELTAEIVPELRRFTDTIYLSQSTIRRDGEDTHFLHLGDALDAFEADPRAAELRTHFHVPVFLAELGAFGTTRFAVQDALRMHREVPLSDHLEIETYTWDVLPAELKQGDITDYVSRELEFVRTELVG